MKEIGTFNVGISTALGMITLRNSNIDQLYFIEDIFSFTMTGKIIFNDSRGIWEFGPLTGNETIHIEYGIGKGESKEGLKSVVFNVHKVSKIRQISQAGTAVMNKIEIIFVSNLFNSLNYLKFSKSWSNRKIHEIVFDIIDKMAPVSGWGIKEKTEEKMDYFYMPYWTPSVALKWLMKRATGVKGGQPGFLFYERTNPDGIDSKQSCFVTFEQLLANGPVLKGIGADDIYVHESPSGAYINKILNWEVSGVDRFSSKNLAGYTLFGLEYDKKNFLEKTEDYSSLIEQQTIFGKKSLFKDMSEERTRYINTNENEIKVMNNLYKGSWHKLYGHQQTVNLEVMGHQNRYCGSVIQVDWASHSKEPIKLNKNLTGYYLIKSIVHYFDPELFPPFRQKLICIKNGYRDSDLSTLKKSKKKRMAKN